jgi:Phage tail tube protein
MSGTLAPTTPTNRRLAGITAFTVNGSAFPVIEFTWDPAVTENETMTSLSGVDGYSQKPVAPFVSGKFRDSQAVSVTGFTNLNNATIVVTLANGKQINGHNMWYTGRPGVSGSDAGFDFKFEGVAGCLVETGGP